MCYHGAVHCPQCLEEVRGDTCPNCGKTLPLDREPPPILRPQGALRFSATTKTESAVETDSDWREEVRRKLDRHQFSKKGVEASGAGLRAHQLKSRARQKVERQKKPKEEPSRQIQPTPEESHKLFDYKLKGNTDPDPRIVTLRQKPEELGKPVIRKSTKIRRPDIPDSRQRPLALVDVPTLPHEALEMAATQVVQAPPSLFIADAPDGREVLFSRVLAGLLDLMLALLSGALFGLISATLSGADLTTPAVIEVAGGCALAFWLLNSSFCLFVTRQTPGMMVTDLKLVGEGSVELGLGRIIWRVLLQVLASLSLVGLALAIFDDQRRCWHDRISRSLVVSAVSPEEDVSESAPIAELKS